MVKPDFIANEFGVNWAITARKSVINDGSPEKVIKELGLMDIRDLKG